MKSNLSTDFQENILPKLQKELGLKNKMEVPQIKKICVNVGMGSYMQKKGGKDYSYIEKTLALITGQKPIVRKAKLAVSNFKLREGMPVGMCVTLRKQQAYNFLEKFIHIAIPRIRDFRGIKQNIFDKDGNCSIGLTEHSVFPEGELQDDLSPPYGLQVTIVTNNKNPEHNKKLLEAFGFPFGKPEPKQA